MAAPREGGFDRGFVVANVRQSLTEALTLAKAIALLTDGTETFTDQFKRERKEASTRSPQRQP